MKGKAGFTAFAFRKCNLYRYSADLSHVNTNVHVVGYTGPEQLGAALSGRGRGGTVTTHLNLHSTTTCFWQPFYQRFVSISLTTQLFLLRLLSSRTSGTTPTVATTSARETNTSTAQPSRRQVEQVTCVAGTTKTSLL
jgi:hypothetical protein